MKTLAPEAGSAARLPVAWVEDIALLGNRYLVELLKPAEQSSGGIWIPERFQENWTHGIVRAVGAGEFFPATHGTVHQSPWLDVGYEALFTKHAFRSAGPPHTHGTVRDEDLVAALRGGQMIPMNDWVMIRQDPDEPDPSPLIAYAEEYRPKPLHGVIQNYGPGRVQRKGALAGARKPVPWVMNWGDGSAGWDSSLFDKRVWWSRECEVISMGREHLEAVFVLAEDLLFVEED